MGLGLGMRTIWIALRAVNYTDAAFRQAIKNHKDLKDAEKELLANEIALMEQARYNIQVGMMEIAMSGMMLQAVVRLAEGTNVGSMAVEEYNEAMSELKETIAVGLIPFIQQLTNILRVFNSILRAMGPAGGAVAVVLAGIASAGLFLHGVYTILTEAITLYNQKERIMQMLHIKGIPIKLAHAKATLLQAIAQHQFAVAVAASVAGFAVMFEITRKLPPVLGVLIGLVLALAAAFIFLRSALGDFSVLASVAMGTAAVGAFLGAYASYRGQMSYQRGTRFAPVTGPVLVHKGEVIYNPNVGLPTQIERELAGEKEPAQLTYNIPITIENVHTKADIEELDEKIRKSIRDATVKAR